MNVQLFSQCGTELVTETGQIIRLPPGDTPFEVTCNVIRIEEASDVIQVDKQVKLGGVTYTARTHVSAGDFLPWLAGGGPCLSTTAMESGYGKPSILQCLLTGAHMFLDDREDIYFVCNRTLDAAPRLYKLRQKYYSAELALFADCRDQRRLTAIYGRLRSNVLIASVDEADKIQTEEHLWFKVPRELLLWRNALVQTEEEGNPFWCANNAPLLSRFRQVQA